MKIDGIILGLLLLTPSPIRAMWVEIDATASSGLPRVHETVDLEVRFPLVSHGELRLFGAGFGFKHLELHSITNPVDLYRLQPGNIRAGILSPVLFGISVFAPFPVAYASSEALAAVRKYGLLIMAPAYLLNPEIGLRLSDRFKLTTGYGFNLVHDGRVRPVFSLNGGGVIRILDILPGIRIGVERIFYRKKSYDNFNLALSFGIKTLRVRGRMPFP